MRKQKKSIPKRLLSLTLSAMLLFGILPMGVLAAPDNAVLTVSFEENQFRLER